MYKDKKIGVVVPSHNEELLITRVIETMPDFVDVIYIVDDVSKDNTVAVVQDYMQQHPDHKVVLLQHTTNKGAGGAVATGYKRAIEDEIDVVAVMDGDAQMEPTELINIVDPVASGECEYTKGNRLSSGEAWHQIPRIRYLGNTALSLLTKVASGYWHVFDSQSAFTAISHGAIQKLDLDLLWKRYGYPNHVLIMLNVHNMRVQSIPITPIYNIGEKSGLKVWRVIPTISMILLRGFIWRLIQKYIIRDAHPLILFYFFGFLTFVPGMLFGIYLIMRRLLSGPQTATSALFAMFMVLFGLNFLMFALWFDMDDNRNLR